jgi:hypothetical protein
MFFQERPKRVKYSIGNRQHKDIVVREREVHKMSSDDLAHRVGVDETSEEDERDKVVVQDFRVEVKIGGNEGPGYREGDESYERPARFVATGTADFDYMQGASDLLGFCLKGLEKGDERLNSIQD